MEARWLSTTAELTMLLKFAVENARKAPGHFRIWKPTCTTWRQRACFKNFPSWPSLEKSLQLQLSKLFLRSGRRLSSGLVSFVSNSSRCRCL